MKYGYYRMGTDQRVVSVVETQQAQLEYYSEAFRGVFSKVDVINEYEKLKHINYDMIVMVVGNFDGDEYKSILYCINPKMPEEPLFKNEIISNLRDYVDNSNPFAGLGNVFLMPSAGVTEGIRKLIISDARRQAMSTANNYNVVRFAQKHGKVLASTLGLMPEGSLKRVKADPKLKASIKDRTPNKQNSHMYLLGIGIEDYQSVPNVIYAKNSLDSFSELMIKVFGIPKENTYILSGREATGQAIRGALKNMAVRLTQKDVLFFYYAGHGLSGKNGKDVYILPYDAVQGAFEEESLSINTVLNGTLTSNARVYAFLDTCFSGRAGDGTMLQQGTAPVFKTAPNKLNDNVTAFYAGKGSQYANYYPDKGYRLFSYFAIKSIMDNNMEVVSMDKYIAENVHKVSARLGADFLQDPFVGNAANSVLGQSK